MFRSAMGAIIAEHRDKHFFIIWIIKVMSMVMGFLPVHPKEGPGIQSQATQHAENDGMMIRRRESTQVIVDC